MTANERPMYRWRNLSDAERLAVLRERHQTRRPWHSVPHIVAETSLYLITAACYEHKPIIGESVERMTTFEGDLLKVTGQHSRHIFAWTVLPNHYHVLVDTGNVQALLSAIGRLHGRTSYYWNGQDGKRGRKIWCSAAETAMKSERHFYATLNYVLHNAVRHGYVERWQDWPFCNAAEYLDVVGRVRAEQIWREYPVLDYGNDWDPPQL